MKEITFFASFSEPIECAVTDSKFKSIAETKCWIEGVYLNKRLLDGKMGETMTRFGVGSPNFKEAKYYADSDYSIHQNYYQWVAPVLLLQAMILYLPRGLWNMWENGLMRKLMKDTG